MHFLPEDHTATIISEALEKLLQEWNLSSQNQVSLTTDSGANVVAATKFIELGTYFLFWTQSTPCCYQSIE